MLRTPNHARTTSFARSASESLLVAMLVVTMGSVSGCREEQAPPAIPAAPVTPVTPAPPATPAPTATPSAVPNTTPSTTEATPATPPTAPSTQVDGSVTTGQITVALPKGWIVEGSSSPMRLLEMRVPADPAEEGPNVNDCLLAFFSFGGDVASNLERWRGMVVDADNKPSTAQPTTQVSSGLTVHTIEMTGTYMDGMPGGPRTPREGWTFRGAIIETEGRLTFIRMTGPKAPMENAKGGWETLVKSIAPAVR